VTVLVCILWVLLDLMGRTARVAVQAEALQVV